MPAPTAADLIFSSDQANHNFSRKLGEIKRSTLSIQNRLNSVLQDATFAQAVAEAYGRPLIANERCGSWYIDPNEKGGSAYFKSTDGHTGVWKFSSRRLNLHLLEVIEKHDGIIVVDSTRRGKRMPDALSKTIPIWCSVLNRFLFPAESDYHHLYVPPQLVSASESAQITALLQSFVEALHGLHIQPETIRKHISKPLRPIWVTPESYLEPVKTIFEEFHPIICCTVSRRVVGGEASEAGYIQGAGDDTENWAHGLTPTIFWDNQKLLLKTPESDLPDLIGRLVRRSLNVEQNEGQLKVVKPTSSLFITQLPAIDVTLSDTGAQKLTIALWSGATDVAIQAKAKPESSRLDVVLGREKAGARKLRVELPAIIEFIKGNLFDGGKDRISGNETTELEEGGHASPQGSADSSLGNGGLQTSLPSAILRNPVPAEEVNSSAATSNTNQNKQIIIACETGRQLSIGVGLAIVCLFFNDDGELLNPGSKRPVMNKAFIASRLTWFSTSMPGAQPSRDVLQSVRRFLFDYEG